MQGVVYHWTISTGFSIAEATNVCVCESGRMAENLCQWYNKLEKACAEVIFLQMAYATVPTLILDRCKTDVMAAQLVVI